CFKHCICAKSTFISLLSRAQVSCKWSPPILNIFILSYSGQLGQHVHNHHSGITIWPCSHCTRQYSSHSSLYHHMHFYHWKGQFVCGHDGCEFGEVATLRYAIKNHQRITHSSTIYTCDIDGCGKTFTQNCNLQAHKRMHLGLKPYQ